MFEVPNGQCGLHFWDYSIGSIAPDELGQAQLKYLKETNAICTQVGLVACYMFYSSTSSPGGVQLCVRTLWESLWFSFGVWEVMFQPQTTGREKHRGSDSQWSLWLRKLLLIPNGKTAYRIKGWNKPKHLIHPLLWAPFSKHNQVNVTLVFGVFWLFT